MVTVYLRSSGRKWSAKRLIQCQRLTARNSESADALSLRLHNARTELAEASRYQYVVENGTLEHAVAQVSAIIDEEVARRARLPALGEQVEQLVAHLVKQLDEKQL